MAVEFIVEAVDDSWASGVLAIRVGARVVIPQLASRSLLRVRLFNEIGNELNREPGKRLELSSQGFQSGPVPTGSSAGKVGSWIAVGVAAAFCLFSWSNLTGTTKPAEPVVPPVASPDLAVLAQGASLRSAPILRKDTVMSTLQFGTKLFGGAESSDFLEVQVFGGQKGYIHRDLVGPAGRVEELGRVDSIKQARSVADVRRGAILAAGNEARAILFAPTRIGSGEWSRLDAFSEAAKAATTGDDVVARFFHYLADDADKRKKRGDAILYFRAAALSNPLRAGDVHGWGLTQLREAGAIEESVVLHAAVVSPRSTNTWLMIAGHLAGRSSGASSADVASALRLAVSFSADRVVTKRYFSELKSSTSNQDLKAALEEAARSV